MKKILTLCFVTASMLFVHGAVTDEPVPYPETSSNGEDRKVEPVGGEVSDSRRASDGDGKGIVSNSKTSKGTQTGGSRDVKLEGNAINRMGNPNNR